MALEALGAFPRDRGMSRPSVYQGPGFSYPRLKANKTKQKTQKQIKQKTEGTVAEVYNSIILMSEAG